jgi:hypothetical protein
MPRTIRNKRERYEQQDGSGACVAGVFEGLYGRFGASFVSFRPTMPPVFTVT